MSKEKKIFTLLCTLLEGKCYTSSTNESSAIYLANPITCDEKKKEAFCLDCFIEYSPRIFVGSLGHRTVAILDAAISTATPTILDPGKDDDERVEQQQQSLR
uniref:Uncharacterized protein n=1 Tax=Romanomermis culicivorax TaxID=13658 RepID=A0A915IQT8_ROMCU